MSPQALTLKFARLQIPAGGIAFKDPPYTISASLRVRAETRRLFQALVVPEYLEAWLRVPEDQVLWAITPLPQTAGFVLAWRNDTAEPSRILAAYKICRRRKIVIAWKSMKNDSLNESTVVMRLSGEFAGSALSLFHSGFGTFDDFSWHHQLWNASLQRLARLF